MYPLWKMPWYLLTLPYIKIVSWIRTKFLTSPIWYLFLSSSLEPLDNPWHFGPELHPHELSGFSDSTWLNRCLFVKYVKCLLSTPYIAKNNNNKGKQSTLCLRIYCGWWALKSHLHIIWYLSCCAKMLVSYISNGTAEKSEPSAEKFPYYLFLPLIYLMWKRQSCHLDGGWGNTTGNVRYTNHRRSVECSPIMWTADSLSACGSEVQRWEAESQQQFFLNVGHS